MPISKTILLFLAGFISNVLIVNGQVITCNPLFPTAGDYVKIIFNAAEGNCGLKGYSGPIWAHTGLITDKSSSGSDWKYVIAGWSQNLDKAKLKSLGNDLWELQIGPNIRSYYNVPVNEKIRKLAFVFRDATGSKIGKMADGTDIFWNVYESGLNISFVIPAKDFLAVDPGSSIDIQVGAISADSIVLYRDSIRLNAINGISMNYSLSAGQSGYHVVEARAFGQGAMVSDAFSYLVKGEGTVAELPTGVRDGINYTGDQSAVLVLYAPQKEFVFLIGSFNNWTVNESYLMKKTPDGLRYWIALENLEPLKEYQFQYFVDGEIRIADPYSDKISDPWNDGYISSNTYPGLIAYPQGKTIEAVSCLQTAQVPYSWKSPGFVAPPKEKLVIYELLIRDFIQAHSFNAVVSKLSYLKELGINAIELMPVSEFEGNDSWGYNPSFNFAVDKYYGPRDTYKAFIDAAHQMGIAVIMDIVLNHTFGQSPLVRLYWDAQNSRPASNNPWFNPQSPNTAYSWGYDFNHESVATQSYVDSVNSFWLKEYHVDGFRFDFTKGFTNTPGDGSGYDAARIRILKRMYDKIQAASPGAYVILEHFASSNEEIELGNYGMLIWGNCNYNYRKATSSYFLEGKSDFSSISWKYRGWTRPGVVGYLESHDEERLMYECYYWGNMTNPAYHVKDTTIGLQRMELDANFFIPVPGPKMIWMFGELGYDYSINYNGRVGVKPIRWDYLQDNRRKRVYQVYSALVRLKLEQPVFSTSDYTLRFVDTVKRINLSDASMNVTIIGNYGVWASKGDPNFQHTGWWYEYWTGDSILIDQVNGKLSLKPGEFRLYTDVRLARPDIVSGTGDSFFPAGDVNRLSVFPNPARDLLFVKTDGFPAGDVALRIIDLQGRTMLMRNISGITGSGTCSLDISNLEDGIYFIEVQGKPGKRVARWIKAGSRH